MVFSDQDPVEQEMGIRCEDMSPDELVTYIKTYQGAFDRHLAVDGLIERSVFKGMKRIYGEKTAGLIVKWVFYKYKGVYAGDVITFTKFAKGRKWWVDQMHQEMQVAQRKEESRPADRAVGARKLSSL